MRLVEVGIALCSCADLQFQYTADLLVYVQSAYVRCADESTKDETVLSAE